MKTELIVVFPMKSFLFLAYKIFYDKNALGDILSKPKQGRRNRIMKKMSLVAAVLVILTISWVVAPTVVTAAPGYKNGCIVNSVGVGAGTYTGYGPVQMTCPGDTLRNYEIWAGDVTGTNRALAALLTALASEKTVMVYVDNTTATVPVIQIVYVNNQ